MVWTCDFAKNRSFALNTVYAVYGLCYTYQRCSDQQNGFCLSTLESARFFMLSLDRCTEMFYTLDNRMCMWIWWLLAHPGAWLREMPIRKYRTYSLSRYNCLRHVPNRPCIVRLAALIRLSATLTSEQVCQAPFIWHYYEHKILYMYQWCTKELPLV